jgi:hypothetical protein
MLHESDRQQERVAAVDCVLVAFCLGKWRTFYRVHHNTPMLDLFGLGTSKNFSLLRCAQLSYAAIDVGIQLQTQQRV